LGALIVGLYEGWIFRIDTITSEIEKISENEANCERPMSAQTLAVRGPGKPT
jgi:transposase